MPNGTGNFWNFQISRKKDNLKRTEIFEMNLRKISVPFDFEPEFSEILVEWNAPKVSDNKLSDNSLTSELAGNRSFLNQSQSRKL